MKRASFLRSLIALPVVAAPLKLLAKEPGARITPAAAAGEYDTLGNGPESVLSALQNLAYPTLRYYIPDAKIIKLAQTGDAQKWLIEMQGRSGVWVRKHIIMGGFFLGVTPDRAGRNNELAYQLCKRATECARDIAHIEGIDYRTNEWQRRTNGR
jgi:hypothetical protein